MDCCESSLNFVFVALSFVVIWVIHPSYSFSAFVVFYVSFFLQDAACYWRWFWSRGAVAVKFAGFCPKIYISSLG